MTPGNDAGVLSATAKSSSAVIAPEQFLAVVRQSGVLLENELDKLFARVSSGDYPRSPVALAERLVEEGVLTEYQAHRFLKGKAHGLSVGRYAVLDHLGSGS